MKKLDAGISSEPRLSHAGVPYTGDPQTDAVLDDHPDILERVRRFESGESGTRPLRDVIAGLLPWPEVKRLSGRSGGCPMSERGAWRRLIGALKDTDSPTDTAERHDEYLSEIAWQDHQAGSLRGQGGPEGEDEGVDAESALWLNSALTPPLEPWEWGPEGEPKGRAVRYVPGQGLVMDEDEESPA